VTQLVEDMEDKLFTNVLYNDQHVLFHLLPNHDNRMYNLRPRRHELTLAIKAAMLETKLLKGNCSNTLYINAMLHSYILRLYL